MPVTRLHRRKKSAFEFLKFYNQGGNMQILMIGTRRSGSNLLRLMLNQLPEIAAPHPPHILPHLMPLVQKYGDLSKDENFNQLVDDACKLVELNPVLWEGVKFDREQVASRCRSRSVVAVYGAIYDEMADQTQAGGWCCKSLDNIFYLKDVESYFGDAARYIYLYRDGRDVAVSFRKALVGEKHIYTIAREWASTQRIALESRKYIDPKRIYAISYETITGSSEQAMRGLCEFLGATYTESMLDYHESDEAKRAANSSVIWSNVVKPVMSNNSNKFLREMSAEDVRLFELVAGDVLDELGYKRFQTKVGETKNFSAEEIKQFEMENERLKQEVLSKVDPEDMKRRDLQAKLIKEIKDRPGKTAAAFA
jgi:hypothetical protein